MTDDSESELKDYKFLCFDGKVRSVFTCTERFTDSGLKVTFFNTDWEVMPFERHYPKSEMEIEKPLSFDEMLGFAEKLSKNIPFVRVDFYEVKGHVYVGELTFYPGAGLEEFNPEEWDKTIGDWIKLPDGGGDDGHFIILWGIYLKKLIIRLKIHRFSRT